MGDPFSWAEEDRTVPRLHREDRSHPYGIGRTVDDRHHTSRKVAGSGGCSSTGDGCHTCLMSCATTDGSGVDHAHVRGWRCERSVEPTTWRRERSRCTHLRWKCTGCDTRKGMEDQTIARTKPSTCTVRSVVIDAPTSCHAPRTRAWMRRAWNVSRTADGPTWNGCVSHPHAHIDGTKRTRAYREGGRS